MKVREANYKLDRAKHLKEDFRNLALYFQEHKDLDKEIKEAIGLTNTVTEVLREAFVDYSNKAQNLEKHILESEIEDFD